MHRWQISSFETIDSTNLALKRYLLDSDHSSDHYVFTAKEQTKGKGRQGRIWDSQKGNLYASFAIKIKDLSCVHFYSFLTAVALAETFESLSSDLDVKLKWPNDVLIEGEKVSGILLETEGKSKLEWLIIGVGVNVKSAPILENVIYKATSLLKKGVDVSPEKLLELFLERFTIWHDSFDPQKILTAWKSKAYGIGTEIKVNLSDKTLLGTFLDLDDSGSLLLQNNNGIHTVTAGDLLP